MIDRAIASIDLAALKYNFQTIRQLIGPDRNIIAMVKADAYGHGLLPIAKALNKVDALGVAAIEEAIYLREAGIKTAIVVMTGFTTYEELSLLIQYQLSPVVHQPLQIELLEKISTSESIPIWLKIDTSMHRLGFSKTMFKVAWERLSKIRWIQQPVRLMTHLADADNPDRTFTKTQLQLFSQLTQSLPGLKSISNSAAILNYPNAWLDVVRPGIILYGVSPFANRLASDFNLKPIMHLYSKIIAIKSLKKGDFVGYHCLWQCPEATDIAIVSIGYGDGYPCHIKEQTPVLINNTLCPIVGRVSMDMIAVDIRKQANCQVGDHVTLWGAGLPIETIAHFAQTIPYELLCQLTQRVKMIYMG